MLIVDTGVLVAAADRSDPRHESCAALLEDEAEPLVTTAMVVAETAYLLDRELGPHVEALFYDAIIEGQLQVADLSLPDWTRVRDLVQQYADLRLGGTDAGLVALAERLGERRLATLNLRHFTVVRPHHTTALDLLPD